MIRFFRGSEQVGVVDFCEPQLNVLAHAQAIELQTGSRCGGHGICGGDRIRLTKLTASRPLEIKDAFSSITEKERLHLSSAELDAGVRLACQCFPNESDLVAEVELLGSRE